MFHRKNIRLAIIAVLLLATGKYNSIAQSTKDAVVVDVADINKLRLAVEKSPNNIEAHEAYIKALGFSKWGAPDNPELVKQYEEWMKKFPNSAVVPYALGHAYIGKESPKAKPYLLKAVEIDPKFDKAWYDLFSDAQRWGNEEKGREYLAKAVAAEPGNVRYACMYAYSFKNVDPELWIKKTWELTKKFPNDEQVAAALSILGYYMTDRRKKIEIYEQLRVLYPPEKTIYTVVAMTRLIDEYIREGKTDKVIELVKAVGNKEDYKRLLFPEKLKLAMELADIEKKLKEQKYLEAQELMMALKVPHGYNINLGNYIVLLQASIFDKAGSTKNAYDSLLAFQVKTPDDAVRVALEKYGSKLKKNNEQIENDIRSALLNNSRQAPPFELGLYTSDKKARLEDFRGKVILLTFWFPGCGPCRAEMLHFQNVVNKYDKKDLVYIGINVFPEQDDYVLPFMKGTKYSFIPLRATDKWAQEIYNIRGEPTNFIIDQKGKIIYSNFMIDEENKHMLELMINSLI